MSFIWPYCSAYEVGLEEQMMFLKSDLVLHII